MNVLKVYFIWNQTSEYSSDDIYILVPYLSAEVHYNIFKKKLFQTRRVLINIYKSTETRLHIFSNG